MGWMKEGREGLMDRWEDKGMDAGIYGGIEG